MIERGEQLALVAQPGDQRRGRGDRAEDLEAENGGMSGIFSLSRADLPNVWIVFVKAKALGIHTPMCELPGTALAPLLGKNVIFDWIAD